MKRLPFAAAYHQATKHFPRRYAKSLGYMDWPNQPNPFLRYRGAERVLLPLSPVEDSPSYVQIYNPRQIPPRPFGRLSLGALLQYAMGLSAWKEYQGSRWELRCNPSSGNLHPTETYVIAPPLEGIHEGPGVYHYLPMEHGIERRCTFPPALWNDFAAHHPEAICFIGFSSIHWREAWKYGERAYRYCQLDAGHAVAALSYSAAALGWRAVMLEALAELELEQLFGLDREEGRHPDEPERAEALFAIVPVDHAAPIATDLPPEVIGAIAASSWCGSPETLSKEHAPWEIIEAVAEAAAKPRTSLVLRQPTPESVHAAIRPAEDPGARTLFLQRRSAQAMDGRTGISGEAFFRALRRTLPRPDAPPWTSTGAEARIHLCLFVHRVAGLAPGLYFLVRNPADEEALRAATRQEFVWTKPAKCPKSLPLYHLTGGDFRTLAAQVSCMQDIAGDSAFSLGMIARFRQSLDQIGDWVYPRLFWEAGMVGQVLYLEAEACGMRGTGIGCYFDDAVHEILGLHDDAFQSMYHFTTGGPVPDLRLRTLPPYPKERWS